MLVVMCYAGEARYAVPASDVTEVAPYVALEPVAHAPVWLAGVFAYRGAVTPVLDLTWLTTGQRCPRRWSSRIIVLRVRHGDKELPVGLVAERVTTHQLNEQPANASGIAQWGTLLLDEKGIVQVLDLARLLPTDRRARLFCT